MAIDVDAPIVVDGSDGEYVIRVRELVRSIGERSLRPDHWRVVGEEVLTAAILHFGAFQGTTTLREIRTRLAEEAKDPVKMFSDMVGAGGPKTAVTETVSHIAQSMRARSENERAGAISSAIALTSTHSY